MVERESDEFIIGVRFPSSLPKQQEYNMDVIVEIRAGVGGTEASLFAEDLYSMYFRYSEKQN